MARFSRLHRGLILPTLLLAGCRGSAPAGSPTAPGAGAGPAAGAVYRDITTAAGIHFRHSNGGTGRKYLPETMGSGCAFLDYDGDGWLDLFFVNTRPLDPGARSGPLPTAALYRNNRNGTFTDVTAGSGLDAPLAGMGCAVADCDNDGRADLYVTCALDGSRLYRNVTPPGGPPRFRDMTGPAGVGDAGRWATSAAWLDYDQDGRLDLFVCNYVRYDLAHDVVCKNRLGQKSYCTPRHYEALPCTLYHNETLPGGTLRFRDVSRATGIADAPGKALGVAVFDVNRDGWQDLYVANDTVPNHLFRNERGRRFAEIGTEAGAAYGENGLARAGMGVDTAVLGPRGERAILVANYTNEPCSFFWETDHEYFTERTAAAGLAQPTLLTLGFGAFFFDFDNDGAPDLFVANGHVQDDIALFQGNLSYAQPHQLFRNQGRPGAEATFLEVSAAAGDPFQVPRVSRGAAFGDFDNDGDLDLLINNNDGTPELLANEGGGRHWLEIEFEGRSCNRSAVGAEVRLVAGGRPQLRTVRSGSSYASASMLRLHFGLGVSAGFDRLEIIWPGGRRQQLSGGSADRILRIVEPAPPHLHSLPPAPRRP